MSMPSRTNWPGLTPSATSSASTSAASSTRTSPPWKNREGPRRDSGKETATQKKPTAVRGKPKVPGDAEKRFDFRTWKSKSGKFTVRAKFRGLEDGKVKLEREDGKVIRVPLAGLSEADRQFHRRRARPARFRKMKTVSAILSCSFSGWSISYQKS